MAQISGLNDLLARDDIKGLKVLVRADLNVPLTTDGAVRDTARMQRLIPTFEQLASAGAKIIVLSHFGRPQAGIYDQTMSLQPVAAALAHIMDRTIYFCEDCIGEKPHAAIDRLADGDILVLENTRFHQGERENSDDFAGQLAALGDVYVNDAFSTAHRSHASIEGIAHFLPSYAGSAMQAELDALTLALKNPARPLMAIIGGAKISSKLALLSNLVEWVDKLVIGGGMAHTFLAAQNIAIGNSLYENSMLPMAIKILQKAEQQNCDIILPTDAALAPEFGPCAHPTLADIHKIDANMMMLDIGTHSIEQICRAMDDCKTLIWNGPLGAFEFSPFDKGTIAIARHAAAKTQHDTFVSIAGGGDTMAALHHAGIVDDFTYVSAAGGAFLEWLEGRILPGIKALENATQIRQAKHKAGKKQANSASGTPANQQMAEKREA